MGLTCVSRARLRCGIRSLWSRLPPSLPKAKLGQELAHAARKNFGVEYWPEKTRGDSSCYFNALTQAGSTALITTQCSVRDGAKK